MYLYRDYSKAEVYAIWVPLTLREPNKVDNLWRRLRLASVKEPWSGSRLSTQHWESQALMLWADVIPQTLKPQSPKPEALNP